jgi:hypothetical protein
MKETKKCKTCKETKPLSDFYSSGTGSGGKVSHCKPCFGYLQRSRPNHKENKRKSRLKQQFNITLEDYEQMMEEQRGVCKICRQPCASGRQLAIDHDHRCCPERGQSCGGCIRGLLCWRCNSILGRAEDSVLLLQSAINYLQGISNG